MTETSQSLIRLIALVAVTAFFAGLWNNDRPVGVMARKSAPQTNSLAQQTPQAPRSAAPAIPGDTSMTTLQVNIGRLSKTFTVRGDDLGLSPDQLLLHLEQLPLGLPAGNYRIVDSLGGVGWLTVQASGAAASGSPASPLLTTQVQDEAVRFIRIDRATAQAGSASLSR